jgi:hypothetical protein
MTGRGSFLTIEEPAGTLAGCVYVKMQDGRGYFGMLSVDAARSIVDGVGAAQRFDGGHAERSAPHTALS